ncbi:MAG: hypothetical protein ACR2NN_00930 [Bryobacteraceae bacterium]
MWGGLHGGFVTVALADIYQETVVLILWIVPVVGKSKWPSGVRVASERGTSWSASSIPCGTWLA